MNFKRIWHRLTAPVADLNGEDRQQASLLAGMLLVFMTFAVIVEGILFILYAVNNTPNNSHFITFISIILLVIPYSLSRTRQYRTALWLFLVISTIATFVAASIVPVYSSVSIFNMLVIPLLVAALYLSIPRFLLVTAVYLSLVVVYGIFYLHLSLPELLPPLLFLIVFAFVQAVLSFQRKHLEKARQRHIMDQQTRYRKLVETSSDAILQLDPDFNILFANAAYYLSVGFTPEDAGTSPNYARVLEIDLQAVRLVFDVIKQKGSTQLEYRVPHRCGSWIYRMVKYAVILDDNDEIESIMTVMRDITDHRQREAQLEYLAMYDQLTGLANRTLLLDRLNHALARSRRTDRMLSVMFLDLDNFKQINDTLGHQEGDLYLQTIANRLNRNLRETDTVARWSGDEFIILVENLDTPETVQNIAEKVLRLMDEPYQRGEHVFQVTISIGICLSDGRCDSHSLIENADLAMYRAKHKGKNTFEVFSTSTQPVSPGCFNLN